MPTLLVQEGANKGKQLSLDLPRGQLICGSDAKCTFQLQDPGVAPQQFRLLKEGEVITITDLGTGAPTHINGQPAQGNHRVGIGDSIQIGSSTLFIAPSAGESLPAKANEPQASSAPVSGPAPAQEPQPGGSVGGCQIVQRIGEGYAGIVYAANQLTMDRGVAIKVLKPQLATDPVFSNEFFSRAKAAGQHHHANVVQIFDVGTDAGFSYVVYEHFPQGSLATLLAGQNTLPLQTALSIARDVTLALQYAKTSALVHGAICPENVFITGSGQAKLGDLGVGGLRPSNMPITPGKAKYMAPEQCQGHLIDARTDIYALGVLFYRMLSGSAPYEGTDAKQIPQLHIAGALPDIGKAGSGFPPKAKEVLQKMLAVNPDNRYISADALIADLDAIQTSGTGSRAPAASKKSTVASRAARPAAPTPAPKSFKAAAPQRSGPTPRKRSRAKSKPNSGKEKAIIGGVIAAFAVIVLIGLKVVANDPTAARREGGINPDLSRGKATLAKVEMILSGGGSRNENYKKALQILDTESHSGSAEVEKELAELHARIRQCVEEIPLAKKAVKEYNAYVDYDRSGAGASARISRINEYLAKYENCVHEGIKAYCWRMRRRKKQIEAGEA